MPGQTLLVILLIGLIVGWLAGQIVSGTGFGLVADIAIGIVGALIRQLATARVAHPSRHRHDPVVSVLHPEAPPCRENHRTKCVHPRSSWMSSLES
jgi:uncharacterized membrane protein YeaQ/YmgE (transglycosylase-associated protein family)